MSNGDLESSKQKVKKAFKEYTSHCPHTNEVVPIRAEQFLDDLLEYVEDKHTAVMSDYFNLGKKLKGFEESCEDCRKKVAEDMGKTMKEDDLFKHGDKYVFERLKFGIIFVGLLVTLLIGIGIWWNGLLMKVDNNQKLIMDKLSDFKTELMLTKAELQFHEKATSDVKGVK